MLGKDAQQTVLLAVLLAIIVMASLKLKESVSRTVSARFVHTHLQHSATSGQATRMLPFQSSPHIHLRVLRTAEYQIQPLQTHSMCFASRRQHKSQAWTFKLETTLPRSVRSPERYQHLQA